MEDSAKAKLSSLAGEGFSLAIALVVVLFLRTVAAEPFNVPSASMVPTLLVGDTLIAGIYTYGYSKYSSPLDVVPDHLIPNVSGRVLERPGQRGDVVVFKLPHDTSINYVKRLIGLPGDRISAERDAGARRGAHVVEKIHKDSPSNPKRSHSWVKKSCRSGGSIDL